MNGECVSYRLNEPMTWAVFKAMPDDIKVTYIKLLKEKWKVPNVHIGKMLGVGEEAISKETHRLGIGRGHGGRIYWDKDGFYAWVNGVDKNAAPDTKEGDREEADVQQEEEAPESFVEDDLPFEDPSEENVDDARILLPSPFLACTTSQHHVIPQTACPSTGSLSFKCPADLALNTLKELLHNEMVAINVTWRVMDEGGEEE